jgi:hypothetical protein
VRVWNFASGQILITCSPPASHERAPPGRAFEISAVLGFADGPLAYFAACTWSHEVWLWPDRVGDTIAIELPCLRVFRGHTEDVLCTAFSAGVLATGSYDGTAVLWNFKSGAVRAGLKHKAAEGGMGEAGGRSGRAMQAPAAAHRLTPVTQLALIKGGALPLLLVAGCGDGGTRLWNTLAGTLLLQLSMVRVLYDGITALSWSDESNLLVIGTAHGHVGVWSGDAVLDAARETLGNGAGSWPAVAASWAAHESSVAAVHLAWMGGRSYCVTAPRNGPLRLWTTGGVGIGWYGQGTWDLEKATAEAQVSAGATTEARADAAAGAEAGTSAEAEAAAEEVRGVARGRETFLTGLAAHLTPAADPTGALAAGTAGEDGGDGGGLLFAAPTQPPTYLAVYPQASGLRDAAHVHRGGYSRPENDAGGDIAHDPLKPPSAREGRAATPVAPAWEVAERQIKERAAARARIKLFGPRAALPGGATGVGLCTATDDFLNRKADELASQLRPKPWMAQLRTSELSELSFDMDSRPRIAAGAEQGLLPRLRQSKTTLQIYLAGGASARRE